MSHWPPPTTTGGIGPYCISIIPKVFQTSCPRVNKSRPSYVPISSALYSIPQNRYFGNIWFFWSVQTPPNIGPSLLVSTNYYIWTTLPQILSLFGPWKAELCRNTTKIRVRHFPVMSRSPWYMVRRPIVLSTDSNIKPNAPTLFTVKCNVWATRKATRLISR